ncbi:uncharacterized protein LOC124955261 [Vespa velutina]|uniref:uncharacterized protein LOC124955261 n=1 Tax=Vespa velutina TaxID=202808 RepID=UPI001FB31475|nr:uncharacterized protein LOC124955261 [Vespa velutina]
MDFFDHPYYRLTKKLLSLIGQWPYQESSERRFRSFIVFISFFSFLSTQILLSFTYYGNIDIIIETMAPISAASISMIKYYTLQFNRDKMKQLLDHLMYNWKLCRTKEELEIMHKFGKETKLLTFYYTIYIYTCMTIFLILPFSPRIMDFIAPLNESRPLKPIFKGEYFIDEDKYFFPIYFHMCTTIVIIISTLITADTLFLTFNSHICGIFAAVGYRLENFLKNQIDSTSSLDNLSKHKCHENIRYSIRNHKSALKFAELIESFYSVSLLLQAGFSLICMSISLFEMLIFLQNSTEFFRYFNFAIAQIVHLFCMCYPGQRMIDYSTDIHIKAYNGLWYKAPLSIHKLLILIIRKSLKPSYLTAGKVFIFCLETFATIIQTATSYFMNHIFGCKENHFDYFLTIFTYEKDLSSLDYFIILCAFEMDAFDHPYYRLTKKLLSLIGQWPYQESSERRFRGFIMNISLFSFLSTQVLLFFTYYGNIDIIIETVAPMSAVTVCIIKYYTVHFNREKIKQLLDHLLYNWQLCRTKEELEIMHKFGKETKLFTFCYTIYIYTCMTMFLLLPIVPIIMDIVVPLNESRPLKPIFKGEYFINEDEHFYFIYFHMSISITISITALVTGDILFLMFNSHICGIFAAVGCRLENFLKDQIDSKSSLDNLSKHKCLENIQYSIRSHKSALKFAEHIESFYSMSLLIQSGLSLICMSISLFEMLIVLQNLAEAFRYFNFAVAQLLHLFCMCYPGQRMIDYSTDIHIKAYNGLWYKAPLSIHKLLILVMRKSLEPSYLTAGKVFIFCLETFATILQTSTSYFMVISSIVCFLRNTMEVFEHPYYRLNKRLLLLIGQWPYQHKFDRRFRMCFVTSLLFSFGITQISLLYTNGDVDTLIEIIPPITSLITITSKYSMFYIYRNNIKNLLERITKHWKLWESKEEIDIMRKYSEEGKLLTFFYTSYIYSCMTLFLLMPFFPFIMDIIVPLNESRPLRPIFKSEYFIDEDQHFFPIYFHMSIVIVIGITVLISNDVLLLIFNSHVCGVFTAVGFRLEHLLKNQTNMINLLDYRSRRMCFKNVVRTIEIHKRALEFADLIESSYSFFLLSQVGSSLVCMSLSLYQIVIVLKKSSEAFRYIAFAAAQIVHIFCMCYPGQKIIDYSTDIHIKAYSGLWYEAPIEIHNLILLIIRRSLQPCYLTAGKAFVLCFESFSTIVQTSTSYFMVISSVH